MTTSRTVLAILAGVAIAIAGCGSRVNSINVSLPPTSGGSCAEVAKAAQTELDTWVTWQASSEAAHQAMTDYFADKVDYRVKSDADAKGLRSNYVGGWLRVAGLSV